MRILHIASFKGNIGDNASHIGFYSVLNKMNIAYSIEKIEIRKLYKNYKENDGLEFDINFVNKINSYDFCVIGGGGFLDYWVPNSRTGTTIDIDPELVRLIKTPTLFASIGSNPHKEIPSGNIDKYRRFLKAVGENENVKIALRNDGSVDSIKNDLGENFLIGITEIVDHGFFYEQDFSFPRIVKEEYVAINITNDQISMKSHLRGEIDFNNYLNELKCIVKYCVENKGLHVVFVPHIFSDLRAICDLIEILDDSIIRNNISVAPCLQGDYGAKYLFSVYNESNFVIGTRFHANVCSLAMGKRVIGLVALDRVEYLYRNLNLKGNAVLIESGFSENVIRIVEENSFFEESLLLELKERTFDFYKNLMANNFLKLK